MKRIKAVVIKEILHILRDPASLIIVFIMPLIMIFIFGYALNFDVTEVKTGIINLSDGEWGGKLQQRFFANRYFVVHLIHSVDGNPLAAAESYLRKGDLKQIILIPRDFDQKISRGFGAEVGIILDGSDANTANIVYQYDQILITNFNQEVLSLKDLFRIETKVYFNPEMQSTFFFIPGLIAVILLMVSALLTSLSISREKERGSIILLIISPLKSMEIIIGKTLPYILVALVDECFILLAARIWFKIPFTGSILVLFIFSFIYIITGLSLGMLISTAAPSQKVAMFVTLLATLLPSIMLSGFIFPLESLSPLLRLISKVIPATYFLRIIRGVVIKGAGMEHFIGDASILIAFSLILIVLSSRKFSRIREKNR